MPGKGKTKKVTFPKWPEADTHPQSVIPWSWAEPGAIWGHSDSADPVFMAKENCHSGTFQDIPDVNGIVIVSCKQQSPCGKEWNMDTIIVWYSIMKSSLVTFVYIVLYTIQTDS